MRLFRFFTFWATLAHILYCNGFFYNTFLLAVFVVIGAEYINFNINEQFTPTIFIIQLITHYLPFILFINTPLVLDPRPILLLLSLYLAYHRFDVCKIKEWYSRPIDALKY
jgi:hypothetical protein